MAIGCVLAVAAVVLGNRYLMRTDQEEMEPPPAQPLEIRDAVPAVEDSRSNPAFGEAYAIMCQQTISGLDAVNSAATADAPDIRLTIDAQRQALVERLTNVYTREDLWGAIDRLVLESAESIADNLAVILDGTDEGFEDLDRDVAMLRTRCDDWLEPG